VALIAVAVLVLAYVVDYAVLRAKMSGKNSAAAYGTITTYYGEGLKNGREQVFFDQPQTETCVHSLFPHAGYRACWYLKDGSVKTI
jgi:hypothetical protein